VNINDKGETMDKKFGLYIVLGMIIAAVFGASLGPAIGNNVLGAFGEQ
jgi:membrane associated rhomboid family serine protease